MRKPLHEKLTTTPCQQGDVMMAIVYLFVVFVTICSVIFTRQIFHKKV